MSGAYLAWTDASGAYQNLHFDVVEDEQWNLGSDVTKHPVESGANISDNIRVRLRRVTLKVTATNEPIAASQWSTASMQQAIDGGELDPAKPVVHGNPAVLQVPEWDSQLAARVLAGTAAGFLGSSIGGALGGGGGSAVGGTLGAVAGSALAGGLLQGRVVTVPVQTDAPALPPPAPLPSFNPSVLTFDTPDDFVLKTIQQLETLNQTGQTIDVYGTKSTCIGPPNGIGGMAITDFTYTRNKERGSGASIALTLEEIRIVYTTTVPAPKPQYPDSKGKVSKGNQNTSEVSGAVAEAGAAFAKGFRNGAADTAAALGGD